MDRTVVSLGRAVVETAVGDLDSQSDSFIMALGLETVVGVTMIRFLCGKMNTIYIHTYS